MVAFLHEIIRYRCGFEAQRHLNRCLIYPALLMNDPSAKIAQTTKKQNQLTCHFPFPFKSLLATKFVCHL